MLLISDLHLQPQREDITRTLVDFLQGRAVNCQRLYILGDLFEVWIGDDDPNPLADLVATELRILSNHGVEIFLMHGNRDFLLGEEYAQRCNAKLVNEPCIIETRSQRIALLHGDILCTRDVEYMKFREMVRNPQWQQDFLAKSLAERRMIAQQARQRSQQVTSTTAAEIMDVSPREVVKLMEELQVCALIHGHTHRPSMHTINLATPINDSDKAKRMVLGDWHSKGWYGEITDAGINLQQFPLLT